jgi:hypothetical protein
MLISEIFGKSIADLSDEANAVRAAKHCPYRGSPCTKTRKPDPLGVCSLSDGQEAAAICPARFLEGNLIFTNAARIAFGKGARFAVFPEIKILKTASTATKKSEKIGKVDFLLGRVEGNRVTDFAALEVQAAYFSGKSIRPAFQHFLSEGLLDERISDRRADFRSSAQKRLMPQLQLKVPVFRRWGKKFFVVVDSQFFRSLPPFKSSTPANSEIIWLSFPIRNQGTHYAMQEPEVCGTQWDEVVFSLREGLAPEPSEISAELEEKLNSKGNHRPRVMIA